MIAAALHAAALTAGNVGNAYREAAEHIERGCCVKADPEIAAWLSNLGDQATERAIALQVESENAARLEAGS